MKKSAVFLKILILLCMILLCACSSNDKDNKNDKDSINPDNRTADIDAKKEEVPERPPTVPESVNFKGETIKIFSYHAEDSVEVNLEQAVNLVEDVVYKKYMKVMGNINVNIEFGYPTPQDWSIDGYSNEVMRLMMADDFDYDMIFGVQYMCQFLTGKEYLANIHNLPYVDVTQPWWAKKYIDEITVGNDTLFFVTGDIGLGFVQSLSTMFYNKNMYTSLFGGESDDLYNTVLNGDWTHDMMYELSKSAYRNLDGTGKVNRETDQFGAVVQRIALSDHYFYTMGPRVTIRDENGIPKINLGDEHSISVLEKVRKMFDDNIGALDLTGSQAEDWIVEFTSGRVLFYPSSSISAAEGMTNMANDYGIIPMPKYDKNQVDYLAQAHDSVPVFCVPSNATNYDMIGAVLEEMAYWAYTDVTPTYFNEALRFRYSRDESDVASSMVDLIRDGATTDFGYVYGLRIVGKLNDFNNNGLGYVQRYLTRNPRTGIASYIEKGMAVWETKLAELVDLYLE